MVRLLDLSDWTSLSLLLKNKSVKLLVKKKDLHVQITRYISLRSKVMNMDCSKADEY